MRCKRGHKEPKHLPYGATKGRYWCSNCDAEMIAEWDTRTGKNIKAKERQKSSKEIVKAWIEFENPIPLTFYATYNKMVKEK